MGLSLLIFKEGIKPGSSCTVFRAPSFSPSISSILTLNHALFFRSLVKSELCKQEMVLSLNVLAAHSMV